LCGVKIAAAILTAAAATAALSAAIASILRQKTAGAQNERRRHRAQRDYPIQFHRTFLLFVFCLPGGTRVLPLAWFNYPTQGMCQHENSLLRTKRTIAPRKLCAYTIRCA
jgi:hypothetical protein